jgi:hypothetical protein
MSALCPMRKSRPLINHAAVPAKTCAAGEMRHTGTQKTGKLRYAAWVMAPPAWLSTITGVSNQLISGSEP